VTPALGQEGRWGYKGREFLNAMHNSSNKGSIRRTKKESTRGPQYLSRGTHRKRTPTQGGGKQELESDLT